MSKMKTVLKKIAIMLVVTLCMSTITIPNNIGIGVQTVEAASSVKINKSSAVLIPGQKIQLKVSGTKSKIKWSSTKKSVATVTSKGQVIAKKKGSCYIIAAIGKRQYKCKVTVTELTSFALNKKALSIYAGKNYQLKIAYKPQRVKLSYTDVKWSSSNKSIASVNNKGYIHAYKKGTVYISAKAGKKIVKCKVTVKPAIVKVQKITLSDISLKMTVGDRKQLKVKITPQNATNKTVFWSSSDKSIVNVTKNGYVNALSEGTAYIEVKVDGITSKCKVVVQPIYITDFSVDNEIEVRIGEEKTIECTILPENATEFFSPIFESNDTQIATVSKTGKITPVSYGETIISVKFKDIEKQIKVSILKSKQQLLIEEDERYNIEVSNINNEYRNSITDINDSISSTREYYGYYYGTYSEYRDEVSAITKRMAELNKILVVYPDNMKYKNEYNSLNKKLKVLQNEWYGKEQIDMYRELKEIYGENRDQKLADAKEVHQTNVDEINKL